MISNNKKSCAMKMLQIALALSLLHVDPDNYLQQRLRNWDSQLELPHGDGWELEMLRAVPMVEYPYANRKSMMPLIEDLIRYDRQHDAAPPQYNVTAYILNIQNDVGTNQTATLPELQASASNTATSGGSVNVAGATALEQAAHAAAAAAAASTNASNMGLPASELDLFLNSEHFQDQRSVWEQNLADLRDFGDLAIQNPYAGLPLKDEPNDQNFIDLNLEMFLPSFASAASAAAEEVASGAEVIVKEEVKVVGAGAINDTFPEPTDIAGIKTEQLDKEEENVLDTEMATSSSSLNARAIKQEPEYDGDESSEQEETEEVDLSPFFSETDLFKEESEGVDVLWKQDVDLGFSLTPVTNEKNGSNLKDSEAVIDDDIEKLKALNELKLDKSSFDDKNVDENAAADVPKEEEDEWAGVPFTVDNETGEYIRLPLDEILNDVLRLAEFGNNNNEPSKESLASTSKAAVAKKNQTNADKHNSETGEEDNSEKVHDDDDDKEENLKTPYTKSDATKSAKDNTTEEAYIDDFDLTLSEIEINSLPSPLFDLDDEAREELADFDIMLQSTTAPPPFHHHHHHHHHPHQRGAGMQSYVGGGSNSAFHRQATGFHHGHHQGRMSLSRGVSMEQRLQDIASFFNPISSMGVVGGVSEMTPYPHYPTHPYSYQSAAPQHAQYPPPPPPPHPHHHSHHAMLHANATLGDICPTQPHYGHNLGSAVTSSMHLTNSSHEADGGPAGAASSSNGGAYKMEHDMMYYTNASSDMNHTTEGFINSILNDEDLHLMDMNDSFCRMVDVNNSTSNNSSVLGGGLTSGHASATGGSATGSTTNGLGMNGAGATGNTLTGGMTNELLSTSGGASAGGGGDRLDASSDSAVSSMGSERVPSLSDGEWGEGSDSAQDYHQSKYGGPYDYSYNNSNNNNRLNDGTRQPPVAQKKHQMFGKRYLNEQPSLVGAAGGGGVATVGNSASVGVVPTPLNTGPAPTIKYEYEPYPTVPGLQQQSGPAQLNADSTMVPILSVKEQQAYDLKYGPGAIGGGYSLDFAQRPPRTPHEVVQHNHTYTLSQSLGSLPRPQMRDKKLSTSSSKSSKSINGEDEHLTRDEKRARSMNIPIPVMDIINLPMDEFNERLSKYDLTENQLSLIRDIRRRGKNKVAAQNCRKRKLDQILSLEDEVKEVRKRKEQLFSDRDSLALERKRISNKFAALHRHIFQYLRDPEGNPCSTSEYSLQQAADGSIYLLRKSDASAGGGNASNSSSSTTSSSSNSSHNGMPPRQQQHPTTQHPILGVAPHLQQQQQQQSLHHHHHAHAHQQQQQLTHMHPQQGQQTQQQQQQQQRQHSAHAHHHQTQQKD